jgi:hypothetical protein
MYAELKTQLLLIQIYNATLDVCRARNAEYLTETYN